jgi:transcriptional regulator with XRE-family HTH domain|tara:strand:+ start:220 stop:603 length:384 start_codon:yes stop_codon:yes gene_type:complete
MGTIKDAVKRECRKQGITQVDLATMCGMKTGNLSNQISRDDTVQLGLVKKICQNLTISIGSLLNESSDVEENLNQGEFEDMIYEQLRAVLADGDSEVIESIIGKIGREFLDITQKKGLSRASSNKRE